MRQLMVIQRTLDRARLPRLRLIVALYTRLQVYSNAIPRAIHASYMCPFLSEPRVAQFQRNECARDSNRRSVRAERRLFATTIYILYTYMVH